MTDLSPHLTYGDILPTNNLSSGDFLHMTICHVEKFLQMADFFSTTSGCDGCDKYQVCLCPGLARTIWITLCLFAWFIPLTKPLKFLGQHHLMFIWYIQPFNRLSILAFHKTIQTYSSLQVWLWVAYTSAVGGWDLPFMNKSLKGYFFHFHFKKIIKI